MAAKETGNDSCADDDDVVHRTTTIRHLARGAAVLGSVNYYYRGLAAAASESA